MAKSNRLSLDTDRSMNDAMRSLDLDEPSCSMKLVASNPSKPVRASTNIENTKPAIKSWASVAATKVGQGQTLSIHREAPSLQVKDGERGPDQHAQSIAKASSTSRRDFIINKDWRAPAIDAHTVQTGSSYNNSYCARDDHRPGPRTPGGCLYEDLMPGTIIWHWDIRPYDPNHHDPAWISFTDENGRLMTKKGRYFVIVKNLKSEEGKYDILEAAIYTNDDTGLEHIDAEKHYHYFSICPEHIHVSRFKKLSPSNPVLQINWMRRKRGYESKLERKTMVVNWAKLHKSDINILDMRIVGTLDDASRDALCVKALAKWRSTYT